MAAALLSVQPSRSATLAAMNSSISASIHATVRVPRRTRPWKPARAFQPVNVHASPADAFERL
jgi:hypothetical protein